MGGGLAERVEAHLDLRDAELPAGMPWIYAACAVLSVPAFSRNVFHLPAALQLQALIGNALPFIVVPAAIHGVYRLVLPALLVRARSSRMRVLAHALVATATASAVATSLWLLVTWLGWQRAPLSGFIASQVVVTWAIVLPAKLVRAWRKRARESERERVKAEEAAARNELYAIQSRAHPHFLFNAINTVASLIPEDPRLAEETLERLADVLRYILETATIQMTPLGKDLAIVREYLEIQRTRFESLHYSFEVAAGLDALEAPPLVLLPLVENAVLHGVGDRGTGNITVRVTQKGGAITFDVEDDGPGPGRSSRRGSGTALRDLTRRLELLYGDSASLVTGSPESGHAVTLRLPPRARVA